VLANPGCGRPSGNGFVAIAGQGAWRKPANGCCRPPQMPLRSVAPRSAARSHRRLQKLPRSPLSRQDSACWVGQASIWSAWADGADGGSSGRPPRDLDLAGRLAGALRSLGCPFAWLQNQSGSLELAATSRNSDFPVLAAKDQPPLDVFMPLGRALAERLTGVLGAVQGRLGFSPVLHFGLAQKPRGE